MQWYDMYCRYQQKVIPKPGVVTSSEITGVVSCYLGLAYSLYLIAHNVELQKRLAQRLKDKGNFQGAYYELIVANVLIRAGFKLTLEDETDGQTKHCEFAAISQTTKKRYWVEARMRGVAGLLGRTEKDGTTGDNPLSSLTKHVTDALKKPATDERLIFIDVNTDFDPTAPVPPLWMDSAIATLERYEHNHPAANAYVIVTNLPFHRHLNDLKLPIAAAPFGLGMKDFNRPGYYRLSDAHKNKQKHIDAYNICDSLARYHVFPSTFDGSLPSETFHGVRKQIQVGETYLFEDANNLIGTVTYASVDEPNKKMHVAVADQEGKTHILSEDMTDDELIDYREHKDAYFGKILPASSNLKTANDLFEWFMGSYKATPRARIIELMQPHAQPAEFEMMSDDEVRAVYCEGLVGIMQQRGMLPPEEPLKPRRRRPRPYRPPAQQDR